MSLESYWRNVIARDSGGRPPDLYPSPQTRADLEACRAIIGQDSDGLWREMWAEIFRRAEVRE